MNIQVLSPGCAKCAEVEQLVKKTVAAQGVAATVEKVTDLQTMMRMGVMATPAVVIDGAVKCTGRVPSPVEVEGWLAGAK